ncbi:MAG: hypothetical protein AAGJ82_16000, partial [Bacteroidota bacterium]
YVNPKPPADAYLYPGQEQLPWRYLLITAMLGILFPVLLLWAAWGYHLAGVNWEHTLQFVN